MSLYAISDLHLSFNVDKPMDIFGDKWALHERKIESNWSNLITDEDTVLIDVVNHEARTPYDYYYTCEEIYTYSYWDTNGCEVMELTSEGTEVEKIKTIEKGDTYTKDLYYDTEDKEYFVVFNSFFEGSFLTVEEYLDEDEVKKYMDK